MSHVTSIQICFRNKENDVNLTFLSNKVENDVKINKTVFSAMLGFRTPLTNLSR